MKRMVELPSGVWIDVDSIESLEPQPNGYVIVWMVSGRAHHIPNTVPIEVVRNLQYAWRSWREGDA